MRKPADLPERHPLTHKWLTTPWNDLWMQSADTPKGRGDRRVHRAVRADSGGPCGLAGWRVPDCRGTALLAGLVAPLLTQDRRGLLMVPTERFPSDPCIQAWPLGPGHSGNEDPVAALTAWTDRDVAFARWVAAEAAALGFVHRVDGSQDILEAGRLVATHLAQRCSRHVLMRARPTPVLGDPGQLRRLGRPRWGHDHRSLC